MVLEQFFNEALGLSFKRMLDEDRLAMPTVNFNITYRRPLGMVSRPTSVCG